MHWPAYTLILGAAAETNGGGDALAARRRLATRPYFVPPPDLTKNWPCTARTTGARADWNPVCRRYEARTPPLAAAAARLRSQTNGSAAQHHSGGAARRPQRHAHGRRRRACAHDVRATAATSCRPTGPGRPSCLPHASPRSRTGRTRGSTSCPARCSTTGATFARANKSAGQRACACRSTTAGS